MTKTGDILDAINAVLVKAFPKRPVYVNFCPDDFTRPCFLIEFISSTQTAASYYVNELTVYFTITCYEKVNDYSISNQTDLISIQGKVLAEFSGGVLRVGDRYLKLMTSAGAVSYTHLSHAGANGGGMCRVDMRDGGTTASAPLQKRW